MIVTDALPFDKVKRVGARAALSVYIEDLTHRIAGSTIFEVMVKEKVLRTDTLILLLVGEGSSRTGLTLSISLYIGRLALTNSILSHEALVANACLGLDPYVLVGLADVLIVSKVFGH